MIYRDTQKSAHEVFQFYHRSTTLSAVLCDVHFKSLLKVQVYDVQFKSAINLFINLICRDHFQKWGGRGGGGGGGN